MAVNASTVPKSFLAFVADDFKQSSSLYFTVLGLLISAAVVLKLSSPALDGREPPLLRPGIPVIGHLIGIIRHQGGYLKLLHQSARRQIATLPILGGKLYIIFDPAIAQSAYRNKKLVFEPFAVEFAQRELNLSNESTKIVKETGLIPEFFSVLAPAMTGAHLHRMNANALKYVSTRLDDIGGAGNALSVPNLYLWVRDLMTIATAEALYGPENPLRLDPSLAADLWTFEADLTLLLLNVFPAITARKAHQARARLQTALSKYYAAEKDRHEDAAQLVRSRAEVLRKYGIPTKEVGYIELALLHVSTANTIPTLYWFMTHVFSRPDLVRRLQEEVLPVAQRGANDEVTVDITTLDQTCPLLVSCYKEAIRLSNQAVGNRRVAEDTTVSDGKGNSWLLKKGLDVQMSSEIHHTLPVWGDKVMEFDPERFIEQGGKENMQAEKAKRAAFTPFGGGKHLCPGRNFAFAENLAFVFALVLGFDILPLEGDALNMPTLKPCNFGEAAAKPVKQGEGLGVGIQKRKGWESAKWRFVS